MPRDLRLLPRRQLGIGVFEQLLGLGFELGYFGIDIDFAGGCRVPQFRNPLVQRGNRFFKLEISKHRRRGVRVDGSSVNANPFAMAGSQWMPRIDQLDQPRRVNMGIYLRGRDVGMPKQDGVALLATVRAQGHRMPAVAVTAHSSPDERRRILTGGFDAYFLKPIEPDELMGLLDRLPAGSDVLRDSPAP